MNDSTQLRADLEQVTGIACALRAALDVQRRNHAELCVAIYGEGTTAVLWLDPVARVHQLRAEIESLRKVLNEEALRLLLQEQTTIDNLRRQRDNAIGTESAMRMRLNETRTELRDLKERLRS